MKSFKNSLMCRATAMSLSALTALTTMTPLARAASHREAPLIALDPAADLTDVYAFRSWEDDSKSGVHHERYPGASAGLGTELF